MKNLALQAIQYLLASWDGCVKQLSSFLCTEDRNVQMASCTSLHVTGPNTLSILSMNPPV